MCLKSKYKNLRSFVKFSTNLESTHFIGPFLLGKVLGRDNFLSLAPVKYLHYYNQIFTLPVQDFEVKIDLKLHIYFDSAIFALLKTKSYFNCFECKTGISTACTL